MKKPIKSLTLSVDEIRQLIELTDPEERRQVMQSLADGVENPAETIDEATYAGSHPMARRIAEKISRKAKAAARRRAAAALRESGDRPEKAVTSQPKIEFRSDSSVMIELSDATVGRLLWLKQNHKSWCRAIRCIVNSMIGSDVPGQILSRLSDLIDSLFRYVEPLIRQASDYRRIPKAHRPRYAFA